MTDVNKLLEEATSVYKKNFEPIAWFGRCIFLSWYCDVGTCKFCFRSTQKARILHAKKARRSIGSILCEALLAKKLGWRIEFLTGGYRIFPSDELVKIAELVSKVYDEKIWLNLGALKKEELYSFKPYVKGVVASLETIDPKLHGKICPDKAIQPYEDMLKIAQDLGYKRSVAIVIGLGEKKEHIEPLFNFIKKHKLDRITFYALKPIKGTPYTKSPDSDYYAWWIAKTRIEFPELEIIAGITPKRVDDVELLLRAGANAITKFPATKVFGSDKAKRFEYLVDKAKREFKSTLTTFPSLDWKKEIDALNISNEYKKEMNEKIKYYIRRMS